MSHKTLFDLVVNKRMQSQSEDLLVTRWDEGGEYEAVSQVQHDEETGEWNGYLLFKDERFSPSTPDVPGLQFKYPTPSAASGALAVAHAVELWSIMIGVFAALAKNDCPKGWETEYTKIFQDTDVILILTQGDKIPKWRWLLEDLDIEGEVNSSSLTFDTPAEAAEAGLEYYEAWLAVYNITGSREGPLE